MSVTFDPFVKFRQPQIAERQIDTLIGLCKGVVADGVVNQGEAEFLRDWLAANEITVRSNPVTYALLERIDGMRATTTSTRKSPRSCCTLYGRLRARPRAGASSSHPRVCR